MNRMAFRTDLGTGLQWLLNRFRFRLNLRLVGRAGEVIRYAAVRSRGHYLFWVVSSSRNAGQAALHRFSVS